MGHNQYCYGCNEKIVDPANEVFDGIRVWHGECWPGETETSEVEQARPKDAIEKEL